MYLFHLKVEATGQRATTWSWKQRGEATVTDSWSRETVVFVASMFCTPPYSSA